MDTHLSFRDKLRFLMSKHRMSQKRLSEETGVRRAAINGYLNNKSELRSDQLEKLFEYLERLTL